MAARASSVFLPVWCHLQTWQKPVCSIVSSRLLMKMLNGIIPRHTPAVHPSSHPLIQTVMSLLGHTNIVRVLGSLAKVEVTGIPCSPSSRNPVILSQKTVRWVRHYAPLVNPCLCVFTSRSSHCLHQTPTLSNWRELMPVLWEERICFLCVLNCSVISVLPLSCDDSS